MALSALFFTLKGRSRVGVEIISLCVIINKNGIHAIYENF